MERARSSFEALDDPLAVPVPESVDEPLELPPELVFWLLSRADSVRHREIISQDKHQETLKQTTKSIPVRGLEGGYLSPRFGKDVT